MRVANIIKLLKIEAAFRWLKSNLKQFKLVELGVPDDFLDARIRQIVDERIEARVLPGCRGVTGEECLAKLGKAVPPEENDRGRFSSANFPEPEECSCMNCQYRVKGEGKEPCIICFGYKKWEEEKKTSEEWEERWRRETGTKILDPDGWDRKNFDESWDEEITWAEFQRRALISTCVPVPRDTPPDAEVEIDRARQLRDSKDMHKRDGKAFDAYERAISALKAQSFTEDDIYWASNKTRELLCDSGGKWYPEQVDDFKRLLSERRKQKTAFDPGK